jgi:hypothetical protein
LRESLLLKASAHCIGRSVGELPDSIAEAQRPEHRGVDPEADAWSTALDPVKGGGADLRTFGEQFHGETTAQAGEANILTKLAKASTDLDGEIRQCPRHFIT